MSLTNEGVPFTMPVVPEGTANNNGNAWGGGWDAWIILFLIFGIFGGWGGYGGYGMGGNGAMNGALTRADLCQDMNFNQLENGVRGIQQGICDSTFAINNAINGTNMAIANGFSGVNNAICNLGYQTQQGFNQTNIALMQGQNAIQSQLAQCCCENRAGQADIKYQMATDTCAIQNSINGAARDIVDNQNANYRGLMDFMVQSKIEALQSENQSLKLAASQDRQNALLTTAMTAQTGQIIGALTPPTPIPAYTVPNPNCCYQQNTCGC